MSDVVVPTFSFGQNWSEFVDRSLTPERIAVAREQTARFLGADRLDGLTFIDIGCGSGVFSYAAHSMGASQVTSFDVDPLSVRCCEEMRRRAANPPNWDIRHGSILDPAFVSTDAAVIPVTDEDHATEYLALEMSAAVVESLDDAVAHIRRFSSHHTEAIVTSSLAAAQAFTAGVDAAAVMVNASTRFTDGGELGFGAEIGISTQKLHARGPMGLPEMTTTTYVVTGSGHTR